jgi:hypothetical protein
MAAKQQEGRMRQCGPFLGSRRSLETLATLETLVRERRHDTLLMLLLLLLLLQAGGCFGMRRCMVEGTLLVEINALAPCGIQHMARTMGGSWQAPFRALHRCSHGLAT